ncbi:MAG: hypothetical protein KKB30_05185 [Proteobacteria bacterium]|nr:hypothetical protein [Pseudomonadota bacterium]MBU1714611.1 hypothetical protein [Pseudomonadota bacterium]
MKRLSSLVVLVGALSVFFFVSSSFAGPVVDSSKLKGSTINKNLKGVNARPIKNIKVLTCPDPAADVIDFWIVNRGTQFAGTVEIKGTVKNVGTASYESRANQQMAQLYEAPLGGAGRLVASQSFQNLTAGQTVTVSYSRQWNASSPSEGEFPPNYRLLVVYDPDISMDGNAKNDDCNGVNNQKERSGADINALFR